MANDLLTDINSKCVPRKVPLAQAMEAAVDRLEEKPFFNHLGALTQEDPSKRAEEVDVLVHNLIALVYVSGPEEILVGCLQRWGLRLKALLQLKLVQCIFLCHGAQICLVCFIIGFL